MAQSIKNTEPDQSKLIIEPPKNTINIAKYKIPKSRIKWGIFFSIFVISVLVLIGVIIYTEVYKHSIDVRVDCNPDLPLNYRKCLGRGCIWIERKKSDLEPVCIFPKGYGYLSSDVQETPNGYTANLKRSTEKSVFGNEIDSLKLVMYFETKNRLRFKILDANKDRYEVPIKFSDPPAESPKDLQYAVSFINSPQFGLQVKRLSTGTVIFDTDVPGLIFSDQFIQITTKLPSGNIYGLGERYNLEYRLSTNWKKMTLFARDYPPMDETHLYSVHPFYMNVEQDGNAHGVLLLNSNAMDVVIQPDPALTYRTTGGILDFYIFLGPTPEDVVKQYLELIGFPIMPPYWALGFQLSRYGYESVDDAKTAIQRTMDNKIPYDVQYFDIDYMQNYRDFTVDDTKFKDLGKLVDELHEKGIKVILILDPVISSNETIKYRPLEVGKEMQVFITLNGSYLEGNSWPGDAYYPDFTHPNATAFWTQLCSDLRKQVKFDGLWIDMNEPSSFADGSTTGCERNSLNYPPYPAGILGSAKDRKIFEKTICMDGEHYGGKKHYDLHSLYGYFETIATFNAIVPHDKSAIPGNLRPFILTRSTYPSSGRYAAHWLGDNFSLWPQLRASIPGIFEFNIYGMPLVGADLCGFNWNTTKELCWRWTQLGAFYPFCRNHNNGMEAVDQDPAVFGAEFVKMTREVLFIRYKLLPYLYTLFHLAHTTGSTVARPLFHEFPKDKTTWGISYQFLWGPALLISPIIDKDPSVDAYFPEGIWYNFFKASAEKTGKGVTLTLKGDEKPNLHIRGGYIIPLQEPALTAMKSRENVMGLFIAPDERGKASGQLFWDDGVSYETHTRKEYLLTEFDYREEKETLKLSSAVKVNGYKDASQLRLQFITICKAMTPSTVKFNDKVLSSNRWKYNPDNRTLVFELDSAAIRMTDSFNIVISTKS